MSRVPPGVLICRWTTSMPLGVTLCLWPSTTSKHPVIIDSEQLSVLLQCPEQLYTGPGKVHTRKSCCNLDVWHTAGTERLYSSCSQCEQPLNYLQSSFILQQGSTLCWGRPSCGLWSGHTDVLAATLQCPGQLPSDHSLRQRLF